MESRLSFAILDSSGRGGGWGGACAPNPNLFSGLVLWFGVGVAALDSSVVFVGCSLASLTKKKKEARTAM